MALNYVKGSSKERRNGLIDLYRMIFTFLVVSYHSATLRDIDTQRVLFGAGYIGTDFFFILSGFLIAKSAYSKCSKDSDAIVKDTLHEIKKRAVNMYYYFIPVYILAFVIAKYNLLVSKAFGELVYEIICSSGELLFLAMSGISRASGSIRLLHGPLWYFSSLLISILLVYPLLRKYRELFAGLLAPVIAIICYGYIIVNYGHLAAAFDWVGITYSGNIRAMGGLCLGCFCQYLVIIKTNEARGREKTQIVMFLELLLLTISLLMANRFHATNADILQVMLFFGLIYFATAYETLLNHICNNSKIVAFGGKFCLPVYVSHIFLISLPLKYYPQTWEKRYIAYLILVIGISSIDYTIAQLGQYLVRKLSDRRKQATTAKNIS